MTRIVEQEIPKSRVYGSNQNIWVDILELGEIAMGIENRRFVTSFPIDGNNDFTLVNGECCFRDGDIFILHSVDKIILHNIRDRITLHLTPEDLVPEKSFRLENATGDKPIIRLFGVNDKPDECLELFKSLQLFKPGAGFRFSRTD